MIEWKNSFWFFDIDDTLIDTADLTKEASSAIQESLLPYFSKDQTESLRFEFINIFDTMLKGYRVVNDNWDNPQIKADFMKLKIQLESVQPEIIQKYGSAKKWSREIFIKLAADRVKIKVTPKMVLEAADAYWFRLSESTTLLPGVLELFTFIKSINRPVYLITSSDARLQMDDNGFFHYDPSFSSSQKHKRIQLLKKKGIFFNAISIGDPEDKPNLDFFEKGVRIAEEDYGSRINLANSIMVGDSFLADLATPKTKLGYGLVVLYKKGLDTTTYEDAHQINTGNLAELISIIKLNINTSF